MNTQTHTEGVKSPAVPEFSGKAADVLKGYYSHLGVANATAEEKLHAMISNLGPFDFFAYGGGETTEMRLRAAERVFLLERNVPIK
jgi:hypothetical protein